jgi:ABC-type ATPase with predicted acetyltransferase domain
MTTLQVEVTPDEFTKRISEAFDYKFTGTSTFTLPNFSKSDNQFNLGIIVGASGSGKSQILKNFYNYKEPVVNWENDKAIVSHFDNPDIALKKLFAVGLSSVPTLCKPYHVLSNGEQYRARVARLLDNNAIFDEYTSVVNRETAKSLSVAISKYIRAEDIKNVVLATCHKDIIEWLEPDWVFDCDGNYHYINSNMGRLKKVAKIEIY